MRRREVDRAVRRARRRAHCVHARHAVHDRAPRRPRTLHARRRRGRARDHGTARGPRACIQRVERRPPALRAGDVRIRTRAAGGARRPPSSTSWTGGPIPTRSVRHRRSGRPLPAPGSRSPTRVSRGPDAHRSPPGERRSAAPAWPSRCRRRWPRRWDGPRSASAGVTSPSSPRTRGGWAAYGHPEWGAFRLGKASPAHATDALLSTIAISHLGDASTTSALEASVVYYGVASWGFLDNWFRLDQKRLPTSYVSAVVTDERAVTAYNAGSANGLIPDNKHLKRPHTPLAAIVPSDGTLDADNPLIVPDASWVRPETRAGAAAFVALRARRRRRRRSSRPGCTGVTQSIPRRPSSARRQPRSIAGRGPAGVRTRAPALRRVGLDGRQERPQGSEQPDQDRARETGPARRALRARARRRRRVAHLHHRHPEQRQPVLGRRRADRPLRPAASRPHTRRRRTRAAQGLTAVRGRSRCIRHDGPPVRQQADQRGRDAQRRLQRGRARQQSPSAARASPRTDHACSRSRTRPTPTSRHCVGSRRRRTHNATTRPIRR